MMFLQGLTWAFYASSTPINQAETQQWNSRDDGQKKGESNSVMQAGWGENGRTHTTSSQRCAEVSKHAVSGGQHSFDVWLCLHGLEMKTTFRLSEVPRQVASNIRTRARSPPESPVFIIMCFIIVRSNPNRRRACWSWLGWVWFGNFWLTNSKLTAPERANVRRGLHRSCSWFSYFLLCVVHLFKFVVRGTPVSVLKG